MDTTESSLTSVKKRLGIDKSYTHFDADLIMHINSVFSMMVHKAIPDTMPFLFPEVAEDMVDFQVRALVDEMERVKEHVR